MNIWLILGIEPTDDARAVKLAYAARLKALRPEEDPAAFQTLRQAYERAMVRLRDAQDGPELPQLEQVEQQEDMEQLAQMAGQAQMATRPLDALRPRPAAPAAPPLPELPELPLDVPLARPLALDLVPETEEQLAQQASQRWLPGPRPQSYAIQRPALRPGPVLPTPEAAADMVCQALGRVSADQHGPEIARLYRQPGWGNSAFRDALQKALIRSIEDNFSLRGYLVPILGELFGWQRNWQQMPERDAIRHLLDRHRARNWRQQFDKWPAGDVKVQCLALLAGPVDVAKFEAFACDRSQLDAMQRLLKHLTDDSPYVVGHEVNAATFQWWTDNSTKLRRLSAPGAATAKPAAKRTPMPRRPTKSAPLFRPAWHARLSGGQLAVVALLLVGVLVWVT